MVLTGSPIEPAFAAGVSGEGGAAAEALPRARRGSRADYLLPATSVVVFLSVWQVAALLLPQSVVPGPVATVRVALGLLADPATYYHIARTVGRIAAGFLIAETLGIVVGVLMGLRRTFERTLDVWLIIGLTIPSLCWAIISLMIFGLSELAIIAAIGVSTLPMVAVNIWGGVKSINTRLVEMATVFRVARRDTLRTVVLPQILPYVFSSSRYGIGVAWKIAVVVEMLGASDGVGYMLHYWFGMFAMVRVFAWTFVLVLLMTAVEFGLIRVLERRVFAWRPEVRI